MLGTSITAKPGPIAVDLDRTALIIIDMQRDFLEPGGFGETLGNNVVAARRGDRPVPRGCSPPRGAPACW